MVSCIDLIITSEERSEVSLLIPYDTPAFLRLPALRLQPRAEP